MPVMAMKLVVYLTLHDFVMATEKRIDVVITLNSDSSSARIEPESAPVQLLKAANRALQQAGQHMEVKCHSWCFVLKGTGTRDLIWLKVVSLERS